MNKKIIKRNFFTKIILPALLAFVIFSTLIFALIIPSIKSYMLDGKREMIRELTNSAWSVLEELEQEVSDSLITLDQAQKDAILKINSMRYGDEGKDYFWITDIHPTMITHPYRRDLNNTNLSDYKDPTGKKIFVEFRNIVLEKGEGYAEYMWQWKDDSTKIVPKLSFVRGFEKWGWVIGTGIYIEDVNEEISSLTRNLIYASICILLVLAVILFFVGRQSLLIDGKRYTAEKALKESEAKYRALVEASADGLVMLLEGEYIYSNQALLTLLGYDVGSSSKVDLHHALCGDNDEYISGAEYFKEIALGREAETKYPAQLKRLDEQIIDVVLFSSKISFGSKEGLTIIVKDVSRSKKIKEELDLNKEKYLSLAGNINIGVFRAEIGLRGKIIEANHSTVKILGYSTQEDLYSVGIYDIFHNIADRKSFSKRLVAEGSIKDNIIQIKKKDGSTSIVSISAVSIKSPNNEVEYFDGTIDDITDRIKQEEERENLITELQTSLRFLNQPIERFVKHIVVCDMHMPIHQVAKKMTSENFSAALIKSEQDNYIGIITDHDLRKRVVAKNNSLEVPIYEVMSSPLLTIPSTSLVFEAFLLMHEHSTRHLAVKSQDNKFLGIISSEELMNVQRNSTSYILREIEKSENIDELITIKEKIPTLVNTLVESGVRSQLISHLTTSIFEAITEKLFAFAFNDLGKPPVEFVFIALGSIGREEQTLISDQDNAIIYEDVSDEISNSTHEYFTALGTKVCDWLNECGYIYCDGEAMAKNPKWSQPISRWEKYFYTWITNSDQQDLIDLSIFFDFRPIFGKNEIANRLQKHVSKVVEGQAGFFQHLAKNCLLHKPPVGFMGKIVVESKGEHSEKFDIKMATMPIIDFSRIYALKNNIGSTNTLERLSDLLNKGVIYSTNYAELKQAYNYLMQLRFRHQSNQLMENNPADNYINPEELTQIEQKTLKNIFSQILSVQKRLSYDFSGEAI